MTLPDEPMRAGTKAAGSSNPPPTAGSSNSSPISDAGAARHAAPTTDDSIGDLLKNISSDLSTLVRQEIALAKAELNQTMTKARKGAGMFGGAGIAGFFVLWFLSVALWWGIGAWIGDGDARPALGWSALIMVVIWAIIAAILALVGRKDLQEIRGMPQTTQTVKKIPDALKGRET